MFSRCFYNSVIDKRVYQGLLARGNTKSKYQKCASNPSLIQTRVYRNGQYKNHSMQDKSNPSTPGKNTGMVSLLGNCNSTGSHLKKCHSTDLSKHGANGPLSAPNLMRSQEQCSVQLGDKSRDNNAIVIWGFHTMMLLFQ